MFEKSLVIKKESKNESAILKAILMEDSINIYINAELKAKVYLTDENRLGIKMGE